MRRAMAEAEVGDEQSFADPTVLALCERVADLLGQEEAVFLPSGTMCNAIAFRLHIRPGGDEVVLHRTSHPIIAEAGGPAAISGAVLCPVDGPGGMFDASTLRATLRVAGDRYAPRSRLVSLEQTTNIAGGRVWPSEQMEAVLGVAREAGMRAHLDGARLMNAVVASGVPARDWAGGFDTAWLDFTKGLGAPVGAVLAGSRELIEEAWRYKQMWAAPCARPASWRRRACRARPSRERLADDHENARVLAEGWPRSTASSSILPWSRPTSSCSGCRTRRRSARRSTGRASRCTRSGRSGCGRSRTSTSTEPGSSAQSQPHGRH